MTRCFQPAQAFRQSLGSPSATTGRFPLRETLRNHPGPPCLVIEGDDPVVESDGQRRHAELVNLWRRDSFQATVQVVTEKARRAALERGQARRRGRRPTVPPPAEFCDGIRPVRGQLKVLGRIGGDKRVTPQIRGAQRTIQKQAVPPSAKLQKYPLGVRRRLQFVNQRKKVVHQHLVGRGVLLRPSLGNASEIT